MIKDGRRAPAGAWTLDLGPWPCANRGLRLLSRVSQNRNNRLQIHWLRAVWVAAVCPLLGGPAGRSLGASPSFANGIAQGVVSAPEISEASGIFASRQNAGVLWAR